MSELELDAVSARIGGRRVLDSVSLRVGAGELVAMIGPNGAGKTTLLRAALGAIAITNGAVRIGASDPARMTASERARKVAYLPQSRPLAWPLIVRDIVALGRFAHGGPLGAMTEADSDAVQRALAACTLDALAERRADTLSGGELARVHLARVLAADAPLVLADEPVAALDPLHAHNTMAVLKSFCARGGAALVTLHEISLAARYADRVALLVDGRIVGDGPPAEILTPQAMAASYGVRAETRTSPTGLSIEIVGPA
jgi:iron complex transport system ATP-binding protein